MCFLFHLIDDIGLFFCKSNIANIFRWKFYFLYFFLFFFNFFSPRSLIYLFFFRQNLTFHRFANKDKSYINTRRGGFHISRKKHDYSLYGRSILQDDDVSESVEQPAINYNGVLGCRGAPSLGVLHT